MVANFQGYNFHGSFKNIEILVLKSLGYYGSVYVCIRAKQLSEFVNKIADCLTIQIVIV